MSTPRVVPGYSVPMSLLPATVRFTIVFHAHFKSRWISEIRQYISSAVYQLMSLIASAACCSFAQPVQYGRTAVNYQWRPVLPHPDALGCTLDADSSDARDLLR